MVEHSHNWTPEEADSRKQICYPLDDRWYTARYRQLYTATRTHGVFSGDDYAVTPAGALNVSVGEGIGWVRLNRFAGAVHANMEPIELPITPPHGTLQRIDRVVIRADFLLNDIFLTIREGTPGAGIPALQRDTEAMELGLFNITVNPGTLAINQTMIFDTRLDENSCGVMRDSVTGIPTQQLYDTWWAWFQHTQQEMQEFLDWMYVFRQNNEDELSAWVTDFENRSEDGFFTWFSEFMSFSENMLANWYHPWREMWEDTVEEWFDDLKIVLDADIAINLANRITRLEEEVENRLEKIENALFAEITANPFTVTFGSLNGITLTRGVWNRTLARIEC